MGREGLRITHLFFADDSIVFGSASQEGANRMRIVITSYEGMSSQLVNFDKSLIFFSRNVPKESRKLIRDTIGVRIGNNPEKYLGLPTMVGRRKNDAFVDIRERIIQIMKAWSICNISIGRKKVFIKSILQANTDLCNEIFRVTNFIFSRNREFIMSFLVTKYKKEQMYSLVSVDCIVYHKGAWGDWV